MDTGTERRPRDGAILAAVVALVLDVAIPLLPVYGNGREFVWTFWNAVPASLRARFIASFLIHSYIRSVALVFAIVMVRRGRRAIGAGAFGALAIVVAGTVFGGLVSSVPGTTFTSSTTVVLGLQTIEAAALTAAASVSFRRSP